MDNQPTEGVALVLIMIGLVSFTVLLNMIVGALI